MEISQVYCFGNTEGAHGTPRSSPKLVETLFGKRRVKQISAGLNQTWAISDNGECHVWNNKSKSGDLLNLTKQKCKQVSCGQTIAAVLLESGEVRAYIRNQLVTLPFPCEGAEDSSPVKQVACCDDHMLVLFENGKVWVAATMDNSLTSLPAWRPLSFGSEPVVSVAVGQMYSAAVTADGALWTCGIGPLGHTISVKQEPERVEALRGRKVIAAACGSFHMGCVTDSGELYTWGSSVWDQLGHGDRKNVVQPRRVSALVGKRVVEVTCGAYHTAVRTDVGRVYTFGGGSMGALGHGDLIDQEIPRLVDGLVDHCVQHVSSGWYHTVVVVGMDPNISLLRGDMSKLLHGSSDFYDIDVYCGQEPTKPATPAHKVVLAARCPALASIIAADPARKDIYINGMDSNTLAEFLHFLYTDTTRQGIDVDLVLSLLQVGVDYNFPVLQDRCVELYRDVLGLDNVLAHWNRVLAKPDPWVLDYRKTLSDASVGFILKEDHLKLLALADAEALEAMLPHSAALSIAASDRSIRRRDGRQFIDTKPVDAVTSDDAELKDEDRPAPLKRRTRELELPQPLPTEAESNPASSTHPFSFTEQTVCEVETKAERKKKLDDSEEEESEEEEKKEEKVDDSEEEKEEKEEKKDQDEKEEKGEKIEFPSWEILRESLRKKKEEKKEEEKSAPMEKDETDEAKKDEAEEMVVKEPTPSYTFHHDLQRFIKCRQFADVTFAVEGELIPAHKAILCGRSEHFRAMFTSGMKESQAEVIDVQDLTLPTFNALLQYLYSGLADITEDNVVELLMISNQYALTHLQELCECYVEKGIFKDNAAYILEMAHRYQTHHLRTIAMNYMLKQRDHVVRTEGFQDLSPELLQEFKQNVACAKNCTVTGSGASKAYEGETAFFKIEAKDEFGLKCSRGGDNFKVQILEETPAERSARKKREAEERKKLAQQKADSASNKSTDVQSSEGAVTADASDLPAASGVNDTVATTTTTDAKTEENTGSNAEGKVEEPEKGKEKEKETVNGVLLPPAYEPHGIKLYYDGEPVELTDEQEEAATYYARYLETDHAKNETFNENFFKDFRALLKSTPAVYERVTKFELCDFTKINAFLQQRKEEEKSRTKEDKEKDKETVASEDTEAAVDSDEEDELQLSRFSNIDPDEERQWLDVQNDEFWICEECTLMNYKNSLCAACDAVRPLITKSGSSKWIRAVHLLGNNDGSYLVSFVPLRAGRYSIHVTLGDEPVGSGEPYFLRVEPAYAPAQCTAEGDGLRRVEVNNEATFTIQARDMFGRPIRTGSKWFIEEAANMHMDWKAEKGTVTDNNDGTYTARYVQNTVGPFFVSVLLGHMHISGSPFMVKAVPTVASPSHCVAFGQGLERAVVGPSGFTIQAKDMNHNPLDKGGDNFQVVIKKLADDDDGKGDADSCPVFPDAPTASKARLVRTSNTLGSPDADSVSFGSTFSESRLRHKRDNARIGEEEDFDTSLKEETSASSSSSSSSSQPRTFRRAQRRTGNAPGPSPSFAALSPANADVEAEAEAESDGEDETERRAKTNASLQGEDDVPTGPGGKSSPAPPAAAIALQAAEASAHFNITVTDQGVGVYLVHYTIKEEGRYRISVFLEGKHIRGSPFLLEDASTMPEPPSVLAPARSDEVKETSFLSLIEQQEGLSPSRKGRGQRRPKGSKSSATRPLFAGVETPWLATPAVEKSTEDKDKPGQEEPNDTSTSAEVKEDENAEVDEEEEKEKEKEKEEEVEEKPRFTLCWENNPPSSVATTVETTDTSSPFFRPTFAFTVAADNDAAATASTTTTTTSTEPDTSSQPPSTLPSFFTPPSSPSTSGGSPFAGFSASPSTLLTTTSFVASPAAATSPTRLSPAGAKARASKRPGARSRKPDTQGPASPAASLDE